MKYIGFVATYIIVIVLALMYNGLVLRILWEWFIVPVFTAPSLTVANAIGMCLISGYLTKSIYLTKDDKETAKGKFVMYVATSIMKPSLSLIIGWILFKFV